MYSNFPHSHFRIFRCLILAITVHRQCQRGECFDVADRGPCESPLENASRMSWVGPLAKHVAPVFLMPRARVYPPGILLMLADVIFAGEGWRATLTTCAFWVSSSRRAPGAISFACGRRCASLEVANFSGSGGSITQFPLCQLLEQ